MRIGGIYQPNALIESYLVSSTYFLAHFMQPHPGAILAHTNGSPDVDPAVFVGVLVGPVVQAVAFDREPVRV